MNAPYKTLVATFTGGFLGTLSMRALSPSFWWIGMIVGAVVGFIIKSEKEVRKEVSQCDFRLEPHVKSFCADIFIPCFECCVTALWKAVRGIICILWVATMFTAVVNDIWAAGNAVKDMSLVPLFENLYIMTFWQWVGCHVGATLALMIWPECNKSFKERTLYSIVTTAAVSPVSFIVVFPLICIVGALALIYHVVVWTCTAWKAVANAGTKIWNDTTYACATASALGACVGHYAGDNPLVGGGAGVVLALARIKIHEALGKVLSR